MKIGTKIAAHIYDVAEYLVGENNAVETADQAQKLVADYFDDHDIQRAFSFYLEGKDPSFSMGICESTTAGYGVLDEYGYFEFPFPFDFIEKFLRIR